MLDRSNLRDRPIILGHDERLALDNAVKYSARVLLHFLNGDIHSCQV